MPQIIRSPRDWEKRLFSLGIDSQLLYLSEISSDNYPQLYWQVKKYQNSALYSDLTIKEPWQLKALLGDSSFYTKDFVTKKDLFKANIAFYAAWSGKIKALEWLNEHHPVLLEQYDCYGRNIAHYAAAAGHKKTLQWIKENKPDLIEVKSTRGRTITHYSAWAGHLKVLIWTSINSTLLFEKDNQGWTPLIYAAHSGHTPLLRWFHLNHPSQLAIKDLIERSLCHFIALSGNIKALRWAKTNISEQLNCLDKYTRSMSCFAAYSGNVNALKWTAIHLPHQLKLEDVKQRTFVHAAAMSESCEQFNEALSLSSTPTYFDCRLFKSSTKQRNVLRLINYTLDTNYQVTQIDLPASASQQIAWEIKRKCDRNKEIPRTMRSLYTLLQGWRQQNSPLWVLPKELLIELFRHVLPSGIDSITLFNLYKKIDKQVTQQEQWITLRRQLTHLIEEQLRDHKNNNEEEFEALQLLQSLVKQGSSKLLKASLYDWKKNNKHRVNEGLMTTIYSLFAKKKEPVSLSFEAEQLSPSIQSDLTT